MKKNFEAMNTAKAETGVQTGEVFTAIERGKDTKGQQGIASKEEQQEREATLRTQGRKGCKAPRINMAFTSDNYLYIRVMSQISGQTMTQFLNTVIERDKKEHEELFAQARAVVEKMKDAEVIE